ELIAKYGADALRFGTMRSAPLGQDVLFDEKDVELGRNFCNKLWNACRFRQLHGGAVQGEINPLLLTSDDKWILLKLDAAIREITDALAGYNFNTAIQTLYRFFWSEFCDWYLEASKAVLARPLEPSAGQPTDSSADSSAQKANTLAVLDFVLSHALRLFHPFLPFITEELWQGMGYAQDMPEDQGGKTIMFAPWPKPLSDAEKAHFGLTDADREYAEHKYELVRQGRNLRRIGNIPAGRKVRFVLKPQRDIGPHDLEVIRLLLNAERVELDGGFAPSKATPTARTPLGDLFLPLEGLVDVATETARLRKELEKAESEIARLDQRLADANFTAKAPPAVLEEHRQRRADWQAKREHLLEALRVFTS
ncbi:MAG: class I tRNA ligase family protein, partial [Verrucomicrobiales bacterium]|nr:class I tRNA ligase family protein [Verrucomicrobiales bacterium]